MKRVTINPGTLRGEVEIPSSKSISHRAVICAGLSNGVSTIENACSSEDITATCSAMKNFGAEITKKDNSFIIKGSNKIEINDSYIDCFESGSTLRFLIPIALTGDGKVTFTGRGKLVDRPLMPYYDIFDEQEIKYKNAEGKLPLTVDGKLKPGEFKIKGNISSQFISGLLFALPLIDGDSKINITTEMESKRYIDLTLDALKRFGIRIENNGYKEFKIKGNQSYKAADLRIEGDFSQAAFFLAAGTLGSDVICRGLNMDSHQGDKDILNVLERMGGNISIEGDRVKAIPSKTRGVTVDASQIPDLVPVIAVLASLSHGTTKIINAGRLRFKESDRLSAISCELNKIGADIKQEEAGLIIEGKDMLYGGRVDSWNDHRIAMAMAVASTRCKNQLIIENSDCIKKSYPEFWDHFRKLGGKTDERCLGE